MSFAMKYFIDKVQEDKDISGTVVLWADVSLAAATVLAHLVAGALPGRARVLLLLLLLLA